ncbi:MAG TPA: hypothetical protein VMY37_37930 [Thermoguttaceae bacterium]|nr:hypothetical protein [Thermoguttaceae bacterium]
MAYSETLIVNLALARIGAKRISDLAAGTSLEAIQGRTHYEHTRDALLRSHLWRFATARAELSEDTDTPDFQWGHQFILPADFLRVGTLYNTTASYAVEGQRLLTDDSAVDLVYIRKVANPTEFDPLFVEVLVLKLAMAMVMPLAQDKVLRREIQDELAGVMSKARVVNLQEINTVGRDDRNTWLDARV